MAYCFCQPYSCHHTLLTHGWFEQKKRKVNLDVAGTPTVYQWCFSPLLRAVHSRWMTGSRLFGFLKSALSDRQSFQRRIVVTGVCACCCCFWCKMPLEPTLISKQNTRFQPSHYIYLKCFDSCYLLPVVICITHIGLCNCLSIKEATDKLLCP